MPRRSKIDTIVPEAIKAQINALYRAGRTLDQIVEALRALEQSGELTEPVSRSAIGRYTKRENALFDRLKASEEFAQKLLPTYGEAAKGDVGKLAAMAITQLAYEAALKTGEQLEGEFAEDVPKQLLLLSASVKNAKFVERESQKQRESSRREERVVREEAAANARQVATDIGLTDDQAQAIIDKILLGNA